MKKLFGLGFALLLILAACGAPKQEKPLSFSGSIDDFLKQNKNMKCVLQAKDGTDITSGTTYSSGTMVRSDFQTNAGGQNMTGHFITDGTWMYSWSDLTKAQGMKIKLSDMQNEAAQAKTESQDYKNYGEKLDYQCYNWIPDQSMFNPPSDVTFSDFSEMLKSLQQNLGNMPALQNTNNQSLCSTCNSISDAATKAQCLKSLNCK
ncbi:MAG: hypothetical protein NTX00_04770 [Candidatus Parcubacteria bacterium]|nr:hypothetical protein [Candidatus Parcubacteria bacterium]